MEPEPIRDSVGSLNTLLTALQFAREESFAFVFLSLFLILILRLFLGSPV